MFYSYLLSLVSLKIAVRIFQKILSEIPRTLYQTPRYEVKAGRNYHQQSPYFIDSPQEVAEATVVQTQGDTATVWLGGVDLRQVNAGSIFTEIGGGGRVRVLARNGIRAQTRVESAVSVGMPLRLVA